VLFMDEIAEFAPKVLDGLRQPLENRHITVSRSKVNVLLPADFLLVAAMNPCPCGGGAPGACRCNDATLHRYLRRLSGPLLDRFDLRVNVPRPDVEDLLCGAGGEPSAVVAERVRAARATALDRQGCLNNRLDGARLDQFAPIDAAGRAVLRDRLESGRLSARGYHRVRRVARTLTDLGPTPTEAIPERAIHLALGMRASLGDTIRRAA
jgi:magnesium chelatase family protein